MTRIGTIFSLVLGALLCHGATSLVQAQNNQSLSPLEENPRLAILRDEHIIVLPSPYYRSPLPLWLQMPLVNTSIPLKSHYLEVESAKWSSLSSSQKDTSYRITAVEEFKKGAEIDRLNMERFQLRNPSLLVASAADLSASRFVMETVSAEDPSLKVASTIENGAIPKPPMGVSLERRYWKPGWESIVQFSENYVSPNWHKGGNSALNLYNKQLFRMDYNKDRISWLNELDWRLSVFTSAADTVSRFRVAEDLLKLRSNFGVRAVENLFYTLDVEARTQLFTMREENKTARLSDLFSPIIVNVGLGMKYTLDKSFPNHYGRRLRLNVNVAPLAYDFRWSMRTDIDMQRHGFKEGKRTYSAFGSMLKAEMIFDVTSQLSWRSYLYYNTSYHRVETEWENGLNYAFSRFFSARINVQLRYDDAAPRTEEMRSRLQINQLLSIGFSMTL